MKIKTLLLLSIFSISVEAKYMDPITCKTSLDLRCQVFDNSRKKIKTEYETKDKTLAPSNSGQNLYAKKEGKEDKELPLSKPISISNEQLFEIFSLLEQGYEWSYISLKNERLTKSNIYSDFVLNHPRKNMALFLAEDAENTYLIESFNGENFYTFIRLNGEQTRLITEKFGSTFKKLREEYDNKTFEQIMNQLK